ncbi:Putative membrane-associated trancriptional regulator [Halorhabdus sp. SVX81]|uniref:helix-turn-helix transcriptional regulator n=1 Tax=Halorhabdus sp. SVX81 TaxID=2978283 RepID=UPI0023DADA3C|nr:hypothetical protein [Halorhabdus sp. SVX81]WEL16389.1 Putative membrane-associated trancriptional regulator [Halorhabdus sp. SVX81]
MSPSMRLVAAFLALLAIVAGSVVVGAQSGDVSDQSTANVSVNVSTTMWIELGSGGDAHWNVSLLATLPDQEAVDSFRELGTSFEANESEILSSATFRRYVEIADNSTGRDMRLTGIERTATVANTTGRLELLFTWENFGRRDGSTVHVADAFTGSDGLWLQTLSADQQLVFSVPESFDITSAPKGYTNRTIRWEGPTEFEPGDFEITYDVTPSSTTATPPTQDPTTSTTGTTDAGPTQSGGVPALAILIGVIVAIAVGVYLFRNVGDLSTPDRPTGGDGIAAETADDRPADSTATPPPGSSDEQAQTDATADDQPPLDRELLSDEEYVEALLDRNGGRMKQANIVTETGWSNAKVSQLLSTMAEEGRVEKLRIGRENLISFPDEDGETEE